MRNARNQRPAELMEAANEPPQHLTDQRLAALVRDSVLAALRPTTTWPAVLCALLML
jgi:hypothetical protein